MGQLTRIEGWEDELAAGIAQRRKTRFRYGSHDCCMAVVYLVKRMTKIDVGKSLRGYKTRDGAADMTAPFGGVLGAAKHIAGEFNLPEVHPNFAGRGDVVLVEDEIEYHCLGIVGPSGRQIYCAAKIGWSVWPLTAALYAWKIG